jgi:2,5-dichlorohydroquinone reductive dechlorinase
MQQTLEDIVQGTREALNSTGRKVGPSTDAASRFELFSGGNSICSQKVRCVFEHHQIPYVHHAVNLFLGQTYLPAYVRMRMLGCDAMGGNLAALHTGSTSAADTGCDGAVVPTLIDWKTRSVIVDSKRICYYLDAEIDDGMRLRPTSLAESIDRQISVVDNIPNYQMLMGRTPAKSESTATKDNVGQDFSRRKVAWCDKYLAEHADEPALVRAYTAKRSKELSAADHLFSPEAMSKAHAHAESALTNFEQALVAGAGDWLFGTRFTMADLFWGIELLRMKNLGVSGFWEDGRLPHVASFADKTEALPLIREAILEWPEAMF